MENEAKVETATPPAPAEMTECWQNIQSKAYHSDDSLEGGQKDQEQVDETEDEESATELNEQEIVDICEAIESERLNLGHLREERVPIDELPIDIQRRIRALKNNQVNITVIESEFYHNMQQLEIKYEKIMKEHFDKRRDIINGSYVPTNEECEFNLDNQDSGELDVNDKPVEPQQKRTSASEESEGRRKSDSKRKSESKEDEGIPLFWTTIFQTVDTLAMMTDDRDLPILQHLVDIRCENMDNPMGFKLLFHFSPNEHFSNHVLTKTYFMRWEVDLKDPFSYEGPEIIKCEGCDIDWKEGKDVTIKVVDRRQRNKRNGNIRILKKEIKTRSFFHFFNPPNADEEMDDEIEDILTTDFELGQYFRERIIPKAVLYYTGEAVEDDSEEEFSESSEEMSERSEDDLKEDSDENEKDEAMEDNDAGDEGAEHNKHSIAP